AVPDRGELHLLQVLDATTGNVLLKEGFEGVQSGRVGTFPLDLALSPDGRRVALVTRRPPQGKEDLGRTARVRVWDVDGNKELPAHAGLDPVESPCSLDGTRLLTCQRQGPTYRVSRVSVRDVASGEEVVGWEVNGLLSGGLALSPDGTQVAGLTGPRRATKD